jgi:transposase
MSTKRYSLEFKKEAVKLVLEQGMSRKRVAQDLGLDANTIRTWIERYGPASSDKVEEASDSAWKDQAQRLQRRLNEVTMERDILKKAIGIFSQMSKS